MTHAGLMRAIRHAEANDKVRRNVGRDDHPDNGQFFLAELADLAGRF